MKANFIWTIEHIFYQFDDLRFWFVFSFFYVSTWKAKATNKNRFHVRNLKIPFQFVSCKKQRIKNRRGKQKACLCVCACVCKGARETMRHSQNKFIVGSIKNVSTHNPSWNKIKSLSNRNQPCLIGMSRHDKLYCIGKHRQPFRFSVE